MRCTACDKNLNDYESTRKVIYETGTVKYVDLCNACYKVSGVAKVAVVIERHDLSHSEDIDDNGGLEDDGINEIMGVLRGED